MRWPYQTKGLQINVRGIDNGNNVTILHVMNSGGSPFKVEKRWSGKSSKWDKKNKEEHNQWDMVECSSVMIGKIMRERCAPRPKAHETPKWSMHTLKGPYPSVKV